MHEYHSSLCLFPHWVQHDAFAYSRCSLNEWMDAVEASLDWKLKPDRLILVYVIKKSVTKHTSPTCLYPMFHLRCEGIGPVPIQLALSICGFHFCGFNQSRTLRTDCIHYTTSFYIRHLSILGFWCPQGLLEPIPADIEGWLYSRPLLCYFFLMWHYW